MGKIGIGDKHEGNMGESHGMHSWECEKISKDVIMEID